MKIAVRYYSRSGNTKKLAEAVAKAVGVDARDLGYPLTERVDLLFLGCSYYAFDVDATVKTFVNDNRNNIGRIAVFGTSAMMKSMQRPMGKVCAGAGVELVPTDFHCRGSFGPANKGRPNGDDCRAAAEFARGLISTCNK